LDRELEIYLEPTETIDSDNKAVCAKAQTLAEHIEADGEKARRLFYFVRDEIRYSVYMISTFIEDFRASTTLERGKGYCVQKAVLLAALARAAGIPSRLVFAKIRNHRVPAELSIQTGIDHFPSHGYTQLFLNDRWVSVTPAFDRDLCEKAGVPACDFDGEHDTTLSPMDLAGNPYVEYLEKYEPQVDLPFEWLYGRLAPIWGSKRSWIDRKDSKGHCMPMSGYKFS